MDEYGPAERRLGVEWIDIGKRTSKLHMGKRISENLAILIFDKPKAGRTMVSLWNLAGNNSLTSVDLDFKALPILRWDWRAEGLESAFSQVMFQYKSENAQRARFQFLCDFHAGGDQGDVFPGYSDGTKGLSGNISVSFEKEQLLAMLGQPKFSSQAKSSSFIEDKYIVIDPASVRTAESGPATDPRPDLALEQLRLHAQGLPNLNDAMMSDRFCDRRHGRMIEFEFGGHIYQGSVLIPKKVFSNNGLKHVFTFSDDLSWSPAANQPSAEAADFVSESFGVSATSNPSSLLEKQSISEAWIDSGPILAWEEGSASPCIAHWSPHDLGAPELGRWQPMYTYGDERSDDFHPVSFTNLEALEERVSSLAISGFAPKF